MLIILISVAIYFRFAAVRFGTNPAEVGVGTIDIAESNCVLLVIQSDATSIHQPQEVVISQ
jgi:hypothetical protein